MLGDLDLIQMARDSKAAPAAMPAAGAQHPLTRLSLDSTLSNASTASNGSANLSSSWGGFGAASPKAPSILMRHLSGAPPSPSSPMSIPGRAAAPSFRRNSIAGYAFASSDAPAGTGAPSSVPSGAGPAAAADMMRGHRMPALVRSLSKGLSQSLDFR
ncbi:MAG: hypothetical protein J3K34DRAFT_447007 [Monoraphidium minutum]|nr:MAG: hypothetical protein J3K34DRAFT_447007 [Monoraphidium minutum]